MTNEEFAEQDAACERMAVQTTYTRFLQVLEQRASADKAHTFASKVTHGDSTKFYGMNQDQIYLTLTGNHWPRD